MARLLRLLHFHKKALEFRGIGIRVDHRRREIVCQRFCCLAFILGDAAVAPMDGNANLIGFLPIDGHGKKTDRKSTRLNSSHGSISYAVFCLKKKIPAYTTISTTICNYLAFIYIIDSLE